MRRDRDSSVAEVAPRVRLAVLAVGAGDAATGLALVAAPAWTVARLGLPEVGTTVEPFLRWIGVFVLAIGAAYFHPWLTPPGRARLERLRSTLEWTAAARLFVAAYVGTAVASGGLDAPWCLVGAYDALVASGQLLLLARDAIPRAVD